jgi:hypothetical protein
MSSVLSLYLLLITIKVQLRLPNRSLISTDVYCLQTKVLLQYSHSAQCSRRPKLFSLNFVKYLPYENVLNEYRIS